MTGKIKTLFLAVVAISGITALPLPGQAATITFSAVNGLGTAEFTTGSGTLNVLLTDTAVDPVSVGSNLAGVLFQITDGSSSLTLSSGLISPISGTSQVDVASNGTKTVSTITSGDAKWGYGASGITNALAWNNNATYGISGTSGPQYSILGKPNASDIYGSANGSIAGNGPHNPFFYQSAEFDFVRLEGITANTIISNVVFFFNTNWERVPSTVPEASAMLLLGTGLVGLVVWRRKNRFK
jgi:PEP-CTERM motif